MQRSRSHSPGLAGRLLRNADLRAIGEEPVPGRYAGVKRVRRWLSRIAMTPPKVHDHAARHLHAAAYWRAIDNCEIPYSGSRVR